MKKGVAALLIAGLLACATEAAAALGVPALQGRVNDNAGMISPQARDYLEQDLAGLEQSDSTQVVILTVNSLDGEALEDYSMKVSTTWAIGQKDKDNGVLLLVSKNDRKVRIEVGSGLEGSLTDLLTGRIVDNIILPEFKAGRFDDGFIKGTDAIVSVVKGDYKNEGPLPGEVRGAKKAGNFLIPIVIAFIAIAFLGSRKKVMGGLGAAFALPLLGALFFSPGLVITLILAPVGFLLGFFTPWSLFFPAGRGFGRGGWYGGGWGGGFGGTTGGSGGGFSSGGFSGGGGGFSGGGASGGW